MADQRHVAGAIRAFSHAHAFLTSTASAHP
jgi:hypothetical protein